MGTTQRVFRRISLAGFALSLVVHLLAATRLAPHWGKYPFLLHVGIFLVWLPTVIVLATKFRGRLPPGFWLGLLLEGPPWFRITTWVVLGYALLNFLLFVNGVYGDPKTDELIVVRGFSGHWMAFYWLVVVLLRRPI